MSDDSKPKQGDYIDVKTSLTKPKKRPAAVYQCPTPGCENYIRFSEGKTACASCGTWVRPAAKVMISGNDPEEQEEEHDTEQPDYRPDPFELPDDETTKAALETVGV